MQFSAYVNFEAASEQEATAIVSSWGLAAGTTVTLTPVPTSMAGTVDEDGALKAHDPAQMPPVESPPEAEPKEEPA